jgi:hypothetical protein
MGAIRPNRIGAVQRDLLGTGRVFLALAQVDGRTRRSHFAAQ